MSEVILFTPREYPGVTIDGDTAIVTTNHLGADMRGDAGLDAQYLADISGHPVIGKNRIGSGNDATYSRSLARRITSDPESLAAEWVDDIHPHLEKQAPCRVELVARSAGANLMLQVAALELIPNTTGLLAIEALRFQRINTHLGQVKYAHYQLRRERKFKKIRDEQVDADLLPTTDVRPETAANPKLIINRQLVDIRHYQHRWASDLPFQNALKIAGEISITASLLFAEEYMAANPGKLESYLEQLRQKRKTSGITKPLRAEVIPNTTHGTFNDQRLYATHYRRFASLLAEV
jgi:hypothetical protein